MFAFTCYGAGMTANAQTIINNKTVNWLSECLVTGIDALNHQQLVNYQDKTGQHQQEFELVIDCRGIGASAKHSHKDCQPLKDLRSVRGELFQLFAPSVHLSRPIRLMHPRYQLYIAPKQKGYYVVGATEIESDDQSSMTVRSAMELLSAAYSVHPGFAEATIRQHISQCRPAFSNNQPQITMDNSLIQVNGLFRHGFLIAPVIMQQVLALVDNFTQQKISTLPYQHMMPIKCNQQPHALFQTKEALS